MKPIKKKPLRFTKVDNMLKQPEPLTLPQIHSLNEQEKKYLDTNLQKLASELKDIELDKFYKHIDQIIDQSTKNHLWECNHSNITSAISALIQEYGRMPSRTEISVRTNLSRNTIYKHLKEYFTHPLMIEQREQFQFMSEKVLSKVYYYAVTGDLNAAKLYFSIVGNSIQPSSPQIRNQNNYIQINNTIINQETVKHLNPEQIHAIERIFEEIKPHHEEPMLQPVLLDETNERSISKPPAP